MVSHENIHTINIIRTEQVIFRNIYVYTYAHNNNEKEAMNLNNIPCGMMSSTTNMTSTSLVITLQKQETCHILFTVGAVYAWLWDASHSYAHGYHSVHDICYFHISAVFCGKER